MSTDELTGVQALERKHPGLPLAPGKVERREFEYIRHGTRSFILNRDVVSGQVLAPHAGPTRTEADFLAHLQAVVATDPTATRWHFVVDNLDTHRSESLVRWVAEVSGLADLDLGVKSKAGILASRQPAPPSSPTPAIASSSTTPPTTAPGSTRSRADQAYTGTVGAERQGLGRIIVEHPGHPLVGRSLPVVRRYRERGERLWVIELPDGSRQYVPASWCTPLAPPSERPVMAAPPRSDGDGAPARPPSPAQP